MGQNPDPMYLVYKGSKSKYSQQRDSLSIKKKE